MYGSGGYGGGRGGGGGGFRGRGGGRGGRRSDDNYVTDPEHEQFRKLFIGGLSYDTTTERLKEYFEQWGELDDCIVMTDPNTKKSRGFGFITYKQSANVDDVQSNRPHNLDGREVETKRPMPREESNNPTSKLSINKMFIGGCAPETDEDSLREVFQQYGNIKELSVITDKETGKPKGFCFVEFDDHDPVDKCVLKKKFELCGKMVDVKKANPKGKDGERGGRGGGRGGRGGRGGGGGYGDSGSYGGSRSYGRSSGSGYGGGYDQSSYDSYGGGGYDSYSNGGGYSSQSYGSDGSFGSSYDQSYGGGSMKSGGSYSRNQPYNRY